MDSRDRQNFVEGIAQTLISIIRDIDTLLSEDDMFKNYLDEIYDQFPGQLGLFIMLIRDDAFTVVPGFYIRSRYRKKDNKIAVHTSLPTVNTNFRVLKKEYRSDEEIREIVIPKFYDDLVWTPLRI